jgi:hypothetical protein
VNRPTEESFLKDVAEHRVEILLDNGIYRHLRCAKPGTNAEWFDIITWPGFLAYSGDMGCFVFTRLKDMFEFFRTRPSGNPAKLFINEDYWAEKLEAVDRRGHTPGATQFSEQTFEKRVNEQVQTWIEEEDLNQEQQDELKDEVHTQVMWAISDGEHEARKALNDFECKIDGHEFSFQDTWEWDFHEYTYRFIWCCYALAWAIKKYDEMKHESERSVECNSSAH